MLKEVEANDIWSIYGKGVHECICLFRTLLLKAKHSPRHMIMNSIWAKCLTPSIKIASQSMLLMVSSNQFCLSWVGIFHFDDPLFEVRKCMICIRIRDLWTLTLRFQTRSHNNGIEHRVFLMEQLLNETVKIYLYA